MKVIHLISGGDSGGAKTHVFSLLTGLNQSIQADLVCFTEGTFSQEARELGIPVTVLAGKNIAAVLSKLKRIIKLGGYDIIHCHGSRGNLMGALLGRSCGLPVITTVHSDPKLDYMGRFYARVVFGTLNHWALHRIPYHIGVSDTLTDILIDRKIVKENFFTIYNGVPFDNIIPCPNRLEYLQNLGVDANEDSVIIGIAARLNPVKNIATLIRGFAAAHEKCPRLRLLIAGDGEERNMLEALAVELGVSRYVTFAGWIEGGMDRFFSAIDINTLTSLSEGFPYALPEGSRYKLATVATNVGGIPKFIDHNINGYLFTPGDWQTLADYLASLGNNDELRHALGQRLYEKASVHFSTEATVQTQLDIYDALLADCTLKQASQREGVVLCGAYGRGNAGDESILKAIIAELRSIDPKLPICVMTRQPLLTRKKHRVDAIFTFNYFAYRRKMASSKLYINGGGSLIQDVTSRRSLWFYLSTLKTAKKTGCNVMMYGCGIGPLRYKTDRRLSAKIINKSVDVITLRDQHSLDELHSMGITNPTLCLAADPTVNLPINTSESAVSLLKAAGLDYDPNCRYLGISLRPWHNFEDKAASIAASVDHICRTHALTPVFIPIEAGVDIKAAEIMAKHLTVPYKILAGNTPVLQTMMLFSKMDAVLSMRLHALIFSAVHGIPLVGIVYDPKVSSFLDSVEQDLYLSLEQLNQEQLTAFLNTAVSRIGNQELLEHQSRKLAQLERNNLLYAQKLLKGDPQ